MRNLMSSEFRRLWRSKLFWIGMFLMCLVSLKNVLNNYYYKNVQQITNVTADHTVFADALVGTFVITVFVGLFASIDHGDKTLRNKLIVGHSRISVYCSKLIVCSVAALICFAVPTLLIGFGLGGVLLGGFEKSFVDFILPFFCFLFAMIALVALELLAVMLISNRAVSAIAVLLLAVVMAFVVPELGVLLDQPEYIDGLTFIENGEVVATLPASKNPRYLSGFWRTACKFLYDFLPGGQLWQISVYEPIKHLVKFMGYSILFLVVATAGGAWGFWKKDLK